MLVILCALLAASVNGLAFKKASTVLAAQRPISSNDMWEDDPHFPSDEDLVYATNRSFKLDPVDAIHAYDLRAVSPTWESKSVDRILVYPKRKLAFCYIEKNAGTQFNALFNQLNNVTQEGTKVYKRSSLSGMKMDRSTLRPEDGWKWGVFLREPLERYVSAFSSKCIEQEDHGNNCRPSVSSVGPSASKSAKMAAFEKSVHLNYKDRDVQNNPHWVSQSRFCGGLNNLEGYNFVGYLRGNVNEQVRVMLEMADINSAEELANQFFPEQRDDRPLASWITKRRYTDAEINLAEYYSKPSIARRVMDLYSDDIDMIKHAAKKGIIGLN